MRLKLQVLIALIPCSTLAVPAPIQDVFEKMREGNPEVYASSLNTQFKYQNVRGAKSRLWPSLSFSTVGKESSESAFSDPLSTSSGVSSPSGSLGSQGASGVSNASDGLNGGWTSQLSMSYLLFTGFAVSEDINRAENEWESSKISENVAYDQKRSEFLQIFLEWKNLKKIQPAIEQAKQSFEAINRHKKNRSAFLYTTQDNVKMTERMATLEYQSVRVEEGVYLAEQALLRMVPEMTSLDLEKLPEIQVSYPLPTTDEISSKYETQSRNHLSNKLSVDNAKGYFRASRWNRPWIPMISWSASYGQSGDWGGNSYDNGASTSVLLNFNLFDGFYTQARLQQSRIAVELAKTKMVVERDKRVLLLTHKRMQANVAQAEYKMKAANAEKTKVKYDDIQRKQKQGIATRLELSLGSLEYSKAQLEAIDAQKKYQQALLDIAVELNEWEKVKIDEI